MPEIKTLHFPCEYDDVKTLREEYIRKKCLLVSLEKFKSPLEAKKLKDYLIGITYAKEGMAFQYKKLTFFSFLAKGDPKDLIEMSRYAWRD
jgi:FtsZ-interacting cell division protein YlmF